MLIHTVRAGQSITQLARQYSVTVGSIVAANAIPNPDQLVVGEALVIPTEDFDYTVRSGDTLWSIANRFGTTVQAIVRQNGIANPNALTVGQVLRIPAQRYTVETNDTLGEIAQRFGVGLDDLMRANGISDPDRIYPGTVLVIPLRRERPEKDVNAYVYTEGEAGAPCVTDVGDSLTYVAPFAYLIREDGSLQPFDDSPIISAAYAKNVVPMMSVTNFTSTSLGNNLAHVVLSDTAVGSTLLDNIVAVMQEKGYLALNIDFENVLPDDRELYNSFLQRAADRMHALNYTVSSALAPKYGTEQEGLLYTAHDYAAHGRIMDFVVLMTYEWGYRRGPPQAVSPINQIRRVLDYAVSVIPRDKIFLGFQIYARDWLLPFVQGQEAETFSIAEARRRAVRYGAAIQYDEATQSPFFRYTDEQGREHEVWFEDARSAQAKFDLVKEYGLRGVSYWALCYPFPGNWELLNDNFTVRKLLP